MSIFCYDQFFSSFILMIKNKYMQNKWIGLLALIISLVPLHAENEKDPNSLTFDASTIQDMDGMTINFENVSMLEFLHFVSKIAKVNFIYDEELLNFNISLTTGKAITTDSILKIMFEILKNQGMKTEFHDDYYIITKIEEWQEKKIKEKELFKPTLSLSSLNLGNYQNQKIPFFQLAKQQKKSRPFHIYKIKYHQGSELQETIKKVGLDLKHYNEGPSSLLRTIDSMQWVESTNSLIYSGSEEEAKELKELILSLDVPKKQIFIEVLVIETDVKNGLEFGLEWAAGGKYKDRFGYGLGNFPATPRQSPFAHTLQGVDATHPPTGLNQIPIGRGFDLGVIGDIILHKGLSYLSLGSLVSALEAEGNSTIILNQKIFAQDNKLSHIFVGDNIPFTGSIIETVGASQQTSANIEYRDIGVKLDITPLLGDNDIITLNINQEITEAMNDIIQSAHIVGGIQTTKTDMTTQAHVPDKSFLVLSGMIRNTKKIRTSGFPCLGGVPLVGPLLSKTKTDSEKRNVIVFVRPQIIHNVADHQMITVFEEKQFQEQAADKEEFNRGIEMLQKKGNTYGTNQTDLLSIPTTTTQGNSNS